MTKAKIKSIALKEWSSGDAVEIVVVTQEDDKQYPRAGIGATAPEWLLEQWEGAIGVNPLQVETVAQFRSLIGKEVFVEYEEDPPYGMKITKVVHIDSQSKEPEPEPDSDNDGIEDFVATLEEPTTQEIPEDDIPF